MTHIPTLLDAWNIAQAKADRRMKKYQRKIWNRADYNYAIRILDKLVPDPFAYHKE